MASSCWQLFSTRFYGTTFWYHLADRPQAHTPSTQVPLVQTRRFTESVEFLIWASSNGNWIIKDFHRSGKAPGSFLGY
jgi:hypothetical protein